MINYCLIGAHLKRLRRKVAELCAERKHHGKKKETIGKEESGKDR